MLGGRDSGKKLLLKLLVAVAPALSSSLDDGMARARKSFGPGHGSNLRQISGLGGEKWRMTFAI